MYKVRFQHVTKKYRLYHTSSEKLKSLFLRQNDGDYHYALSDISFDVEEGEIIGVIGLNGSGKSTLSNLIAGVTMPDSGTIEINGTSLLIAISSGLNPQLTGRENIELKGLMMGLTKSQIETITPQVIEFSEIGKFIDQPVKTYSSGMKARLGFSISVNVDPDILVIDEALSVGDQAFADKCLDKINEFKESGKTIFFVSHSLGQIKKFCTKILWLHYGQLQAYGELNEVAQQYQKFVEEHRKLSSAEKEEMKEFYQNKAKEQNEMYKPVRKQRKKNKKKARVAGLGVLIALGGGAFLWQQRDSIPQSVQESKQGPITEQQVASDVTKIEEPKQTETIKRFVVTGSEVFVRQTPSAEATKLGVVRFGDVFEVQKQEKDTKKDLLWAEVTLLSGQKGWISTQFLMEMKQPISDASLSSLDRRFQPEFGAKVLQFTSYVGKTWDDLKKQYKGVLTAPTKPSSEGRMYVNSDNVQFVIRENKIEKVAFQNPSIKPKDIVGTLGKPVTTSEQQDGYFYETDSYYITIQVDRVKDSVIAVFVTKK
ncbi:teichoic acids export ABC transporter ATP-binding subunit TagH [Ectobacillus antri]|uniref:teichoic acids export ABC transporter ATP-binding subunit TagH n=1 Tax=Ectobacillus antri TaxID=2486280 RepID=UPI000F597F4D|nr:teichoic acids export ABC transporter ATP-binding subunit TagH [Ectobacillus antri]